MKKKRNRKAIIITTIVMLIGILLVLAGFFGGSVMALFNKSFDYTNIQPEDLGKDFRTDILVIYDDVKIPNKTLQYFTGSGGEDLYMVLDLSDLSEEEQRLYYSKYHQYITIEGRLTTLDEEKYKEVSEALFEMYDYIYYQKIAEADPDKIDPSHTLEWFHETMLLNTLSPYCIEVKSVTAFNWIPFIPAGIFLFLVSLIIEICLVFKFKKRIVLPVVYGLMVIVPAVLFFNHIRTMLSVNKITDGLYTMKNLECTDTQAMLDSNTVTTNDLLDWIFKNHFYGAPNVFNISKDQFGFGCATFAAVTPDGDHLFGRNFDLNETDTLLIYSHPQGAYESIGVADLTIFGVGQFSQLSPDSALGKLVMTITPYAVLDGMNEKGVAAGILTINGDNIDQDNGKPDLLLYCAIRGILDNCASVDEALSLLESYDIHSDLGNYHLFVTDRSGRYAVVEWLDGEMVVTEYPYCTNSVIAPGKYYNTGIVDDRLGIIEEELGSDRLVTEQEAMAVLNKAQDRHGMTEWSCVYNLDDFTVSICIDADYDNVYTFSAGDLA